MTPFDEEAIRQGWIPVLHEEPVYFRQMPDNDFEIVMCSIKKDRYDLDNKWLLEGVIPAGGVSKYVKTTLRIAFERYVFPAHRLQMGILIALNDYYWSNIPGIDWKQKKKEFERFHSFIKTLK